MIYLSGPMSGYPGHNFAEFNRVAFRLRDRGHEVLNPAELGGNDGSNHPWSFYLRRDIKEMMDCDGVALLPGWEASRGAVLEVHIAHALGMTVLPWHLW